MASSAAEATGADTASPEYQQAEDAPTELVADPPGADTDPATVAGPLTVDNRSIPPTGLLTEGGQPKPTSLSVAKDQSEPDTLPKPTKVLGSGATASAVHGKPDGQPDRFAQRYGMTRPSDHDRGGGSYHPRSTGPSYRDPTTSRSETGEASTSHGARQPDADEFLDDLGALYQDALRSFKEQFAIDMHAIVRRSTRAVNDSRQLQR